MANEEALDFTNLGTTIGIANSLQAPDTAGLRANQAGFDEEQAKLDQQAQERIAIISGLADASNVLSAKGQETAEALVDSKINRATQSTAISDESLDRTAAFNVALGFTNSQMLKANESLSAMSSEIRRENTRDLALVEQGNSLGIMDLLTDPTGTLAAKVTGRKAQQNIDLNAKASSIIRLNRSNLEADYKLRQSKMAQEAKFKTAMMVKKEKQFNATKLAVTTLTLKESIAVLATYYGFNDSILKSINTQMGNLRAKRSANMQNIQAVLQEAQFKQSMINIGLTVEQAARDGATRDSVNKIMADMAEYIPALNITDGDGNKTPLKIAAFERLSKNGMVTKDLISAVSLAFEYHGSGDAGVGNSKTPIDDIRNE